jgi:hypothetical protein
VRSGHSRKCIGRYPAVERDFDSVGVTQDRARSLCTCTALHSPPLAVGILRSFNAAAICRSEVAPPACIACTRGIKSLECLLETQIRTSASTATVLMRVEWGKSVPQDKGAGRRVMVVFSAGTCTIKMLSVSLAGRFAGFRGLDLINLAITTNARGGPGIVLASVAFDAGIISSQFYTTLVVAAVFTSQIAGAWLDYVLRKEWPLLTPAASAEAVEVCPETPSMAGESPQLPVA